LIAIQIGVDDRNNEIGSELGTEMARGEGLELATGALHSLGGSRERFPHGFDPKTWYEGVWYLGTLVSPSEASATSFLPGYVLL